MSWKDLFMGAVALAIVAGFVFAFGPGVAAAMFVGFGVMMAISLACFAGVVALIYYATVYRSQRYAKQLEEAGYDAQLDRFEVWEFATMCLVTVVITPMAAYFGRGAWEVHLCVQAGECAVPPGWYFLAPVVTGLLAFLALYAFGYIVWQWYSSFRPIRRAYQELQLGHDPGLPRLP